MDLIDCIQACKTQLADLAAAPDSAAADQARASARRLGQRYLMRYVLLICFREYLQGWLAGEGRGGTREGSRFREWFDERKELLHLLQHCSI
jgi:hypothetical protein